VPTLAKSVARAVAVIRMWPQLDLQGGLGAECAMLVTSCLELGVALAHANMCASCPIPSTNPVAPYPGGNVVHTSLFFGRLTL
jgi:hypothetical protein